MVQQVTIPALPSQLFQPPKLCQSMEEARNYAAEHVLLQFGIPLDSGAGMEIYCAKYLSVCINQMPQVQEKINLLLVM